MSDTFDEQTDEQNGEEAQPREEKERDVELEPVIVGPPGYGSPDPTTVAGRLTTLDVHPDVENIAADYGSDVTQEQIDLAMPYDENAEQEKADTGTESADELDKMKKDELVALADERGVDTEGMTKAEIVDALAVDDSEETNGN